MNKKFMKRALELARGNLSTLNGGPFGAVIIKNNEIIGEGSNQVLKNKDPTAHAEIVAIREACKNLNSFQLEGCEIYCSCEPCPMCLGAIYWSRPEKIYFAASSKDAAKANFDDSLIYKECCIPINKRSIPTQQIHIEGATDVFDEWNKNDKKIPY